MTPIKQVGRRRRAEPFTGTPPDVKAGDLVWCRTVLDAWVRRVALDQPRYDHDHAFGRTHLTVPTTDLANWPLRDNQVDDGLNWPAQDVLPDSAEPPGPLWADTP